MKGTIKSLSGSQLSRTVETQQLATTADVPRRKRRNKRPDHPLRRSAHG